MRVVQSKGKAAKTLSLLAGIIMAFSVMAGCSGNNGSGENGAAPPGAQAAAPSGEATASASPASWISDTPLEVTALFGDNAGYKDDWLFLKELKAKTNVDLKLQVVPDKDFKDKRNLALSAGEAPDLILKTYPEEIINFANPDTLVPIDDIIDKLPNFKKRMEDTSFQQEYDTYYKMGDGKHYILPAWGTQAAPWEVLFYRADLFKKHEIPLPTSYDELASSLQKLKELYPDSAPLTNRFGEGLLLSAISRSFGTNGGWSLPNGYTYDWDAQKWVFAATTDGYKDMVVYLRKLMADGLLDKEAFTQDGNVFDQKLTTGVSFAGYGWLGEELRYNTEGKKNVGPDYELKWMDPLTGPTGKAYSKSSKRGGVGLAINAQAMKNPDFDKILKFVDWLWYSPDGQDFVNWGIEGVTYTSADGTKKLAEDIQNWNNTEANKELRKEYGFNVDQFAFAIPEDFKRNSVNPDYQTYFDKLTSLKAVPLDDPNVMLSDDEVEQTKILITKLNDYTKQQLYAFVLGSADIGKDWDSYVKECADKGSQELLDIVNGAWARVNP